MSHHHQFSGEEIGILENKNWQSFELYCNEIPPKLLKCFRPNRQYLIHEEVRKNVTAEPAYNFSEDILLISV
jgi:hypothetical protein